MSYSIDFVKYALSIGAIELVPEGRKLKSGRISPYFFNAGLFCTGESIARLASAYTETIYRLPGFFPDVIFGPSYKGSPIAVAATITIGGKVGYAYNRKEAKDHGEGGIVIGAQLRGKRVLLVDDVMTTGDSLGEANKIVHGEGGIPIGCVIAFDRQERGKETNLSAVQEFESKYHIPVFAAATFNDLIALCSCDEALPASLYPTILDKLLAYKQQYGA